MSSSRRFLPARYPYLSALGPTDGDDDAQFIQAQLRAYRLHERHVVRLENQVLASIAMSSSASDTPTPRKLRIAERMLAYRTEALRRREDFLEDLAALEGPILISDEDKADTEKQEVVDLDKENTLPPAPIPPPEKQPPPTCCIDLEKILPGQMVVRLPCMCVFHRKCLMPYLLSTPNPRCPIDRTEIDPSTVHLLPVYKWGDNS